MNKSIFLLPTLLFSVACTPTANPPVSGKPPAQISTSEQSAKNAQTDKVGQMSQAELEDQQAVELLQSALLLDALSQQSGDSSADSGSASGSSSSGEADPWAGTCGPNAGYEEQLVCNGVPGGSVPRG